MKRSRLEEDKNIADIIIQNVRNLFTLKKLKKETNDTVNKYIRNRFRLNKENNAIKDRMIRDIRNLFEHGDIRDTFKLKKKGN